MEEKYIIYALCEPDTEEIRYIGKSSTGLERPRQSLCPSMLKKNNHKHNWIKSVLAQGKKPIIKIIKVSNEQELDRDEIYYINEYKKTHRLTNTGKGGVGGAHTKYHLISKPVKSICIENGEEKIYSSVQSTIIDGFNPNTVARVARGIGKSHKGYRFIYLDKEKHALEVDKITLTAFGETKTIRYWLKDDRCKASYYQIKSRIAQGLSDLEILTKEKKYQPPIGIDSWACKISENDVYHIRKLYDEGNKISDIAQKYNTSRGNVCGIGKRKRWKHLQEKYYEDNI